MMHYKKPKAHSILETTAIRYCLLSGVCQFCYLLLFAQVTREQIFTKADTLRGTLHPKGPGGMCCVTTFLSLRIITIKR